MLLKLQGQNLDTCAKVRIHLKETTKVVSGTHLMRSALFTTLHLRDTSAVRIAVETEMAVAMSLTVAIQT